MSSRWPRLRSPSMCRTARYATRGSRLAASPRFHGALAKPKPCCGVSGSTTPSPTARRRLLLPQPRPASTTHSRLRSANASFRARCTGPQRWRFEMSTAAPEPKANMGQPIPSYDAIAKVTGNAEYAADVALVNPAYAYLVTSSIAKGRVDSFDLAAAKQVRGVIDIVTHENAGKLKEAKLFSNGGYAATTIQPLKSAEIAQAGQMVAVVVAETFEAARQAAHAVKVNYIAAMPTATFDSAGTTSAPAKGQLAQFKEDPKVGDFAKAFG